MTPEDIPPRRGINALLAVCLLALSPIFLLPIVGTLYYDGFDSIWDWPVMLYGFLAIGGAFIALGARLLISPQKVGADVSFHDGGFNLSVRLFFRRGWSHRLDWRDIEEMKLIEAPRGGDVLAFRLTYDASIREELIQPTTRVDAPKALVGREVRLPLRFSAVSIGDAVARFKTSAEQAGAMLVEASSFNVVVFVRRLWVVEWP